MTIANEIQRIQEGIKDVYDAAETKGATLPATKNSANLATCIDSISQGGIYDELASYQVVDGILQRTSKVLNGTEFKDITTAGYEAFTNAFYYCTNLTGKFSMPDLTTINGDRAFSAVFIYTNINEVDLSSLSSIIGNNVFEYAFNQCTSLTAVDLSSLVTISGSYTFSYAFENCLSLTNIDLSSLTSIPNYGFDYTFHACKALTSIFFPALTTVKTYGLNYTFYDCSVLTQVSLPELTTIEEYGFYETFFYCTALTTISFPKLNNISNDCFHLTFYDCTNLLDIYFNALTTTSFSSYTNQFYKMMNGTGKTKTHTIHFPSNLQSTIQGLIGYPNFGGSSGYVTLSFDLPATS